MPVDYDMIPRATYCHPQIGSFGYTEQQAKDKGHDVKTATFPFSANGKAWASATPSASSRSSPTPSTTRSSAPHMIGPDVTELLPVLTLARSGT
jgi:dihydrolipoamide dehydrogenase